MAIHGYGSEDAGTVSDRAVELCRKIGEQVELAAVLWPLVDSRVRGNDM